MNLLPSSAPQCADNNAGLGKADSPSMRNTAVAAVRVGLLTGLAALLSVSGAWADGTAATTDGPAPRIIGGQTASPGDFPSVMPMLVNRDGVSVFQRQGCAATLIAPNWVITAAHCVVDDDGNTVPTSQWVVLPGVTTLSDDPAGGRAGEVGVTNIIAHPEFDARRFYNDIALMELAETVDLPTVALYSGAPGSLVDTNAFIVGWGVADLSDPSRPAFPLDQLFASVPIITNDVCNAPQSYNGDIIESQVCAGFAQGGIDSCQGDSGGPMITAIDNFQVQAGIVSFGNGCADPNFYGVYTNVSSFRAWISNFVDARYLPADPQVDDPPVEPPVEPPVIGDPPEVDNELPETDIQNNPGGPNPFTTGGSSGGGGAGFALALLSGVLLLFRRRGV